MDLKNAFKTASKVFDKTATALCVSALAFTAASVCYPPLFLYAVNYCPGLIPAGCAAMGGIALRNSLRRDSSQDLRSTAKAALAISILGGGAYFGAEAIQSLPTALAVSFASVCSIPLASAMNLVSGRQENNGLSDFAKAPAGKAQPRCGG